MEIYADRIKIKTTECNGQQLSSQTAAWDIQNKYLSFFDALRMLRWNFMRLSFFTAYEFALLVEKSCGLQAEWAWYPHIWKMKKVVVYKLSEHDTHIFDKFQIRHHLVIKFQQSILVQLSFIVFGATWLSVELTRSAIRK